MTRPKAEQGLMPSVLDRLIDADASGTAWRRGYGLEQIVEAVRRDLEDLVNTRQSHPDVPAEFNELRRSILLYGLPDFGSLSAFTSQQRQEIARLLEAVVNQFEPRLRDVRATLLDAADDKSRTVHFRIDARLRLEPAPNVVFETTLDLGTGRYSIQQGES
jgi:type VI secretion system protein ImpF